MLPDTSLCAIVRDEAMNPAGGIMRFCKAHVPHVEKAVIVDTGSVDGTREILEDLESCYPNLTVHDREFDNYSASRNYALEQVQTKNALVLDADELIVSKDWKKLGEEIQEENKSGAWRLPFIEIRPDGTSKLIVGHHERLFRLQPNRRFRGALNEYLYDSFFLPVCGKPVNVPIYHFSCPKDGARIKYKQWYAKMRWRRFVTKQLGKYLPAPSQTKKFQHWKEFNPHRDKYA